MNLSAPNAKERKLNPVQSRLYISHYYYMNILAINYND